MAYRRLYAIRIVGSLSGQLSSPERFGRRCIAVTSRVHSMFVSSCLIRLQGRPLCSPPPGTVAARRPADLIRKRCRMDIDRPEATANGQPSTSGKQVLTCGRCAVRDRLVCRCSCSSTCMAAYRMRKRAQTTTLTPTRTLVGF